MPKYDSPTKCIEIYQCTNIIKRALKRTKVVVQNNTFTGP